jgi:hypothetical protein
MKELLQTGSCGRVPMPPEKSDFLSIVSAIPFAPVALMTRSARLVTDVRLSRASARGSALAFLVLCQALWGTLPVCVQAASGFEGWKIQSWSGQGSGSFQNSGNTVLLSGGAGLSDQTVLVRHKAPLHMPPNGFLRIAARLRGEDITNYACIYAAIRQGGLQDLSSRKLSGTFEWQDVDLLLNPAVAVAEAAYLSIKLFGPGRLWIEAVRVEMLSEQEADILRQREAKAMKSGRAQRIGRLMEAFEATLPPAAESDVELFRIWGTHRPAFAPVPPGWQEISRPAAAESWEAPMELTADQKIGYTVFSRPALEPVGLDALPRQQDRTLPVKAFATPGEYEPLTFSVRALRDLRGVRVSVSDLTNGLNVLSSGYTDVRTVGFIRLVQDRARKRYCHEPFLLEKGPDFIDENTTRRYWITVRVPDMIVPGVYSGTIRFSAQDVPPSDIPMALRVLPFPLPEPDGTMFVWWDHASGTRRYPIEHEFLDQREHGMSTFIARANRPTRGGMVDDQDIERMARDLDAYIRIHRDLGFRHPLIGGHSNHQIVYKWDQAIRWFRMDPRSEALDNNFLSVYRRLYLEEGRRKGWPQLFHYVFDEPGGARPELLPDSVHYLSLLKNTYPELKTWVTFGGGMAQGYDEIGLMGPALDYWVVNRFTPEIAKRFRENEKPVWVYNGGGMFGRGPRRNRFFYGVYGHKISAAGQGQWIYAFEGTGSPYECPLVEAPDGNNGYVFRGYDGPIPSTFWETLREGVDDRRYLCLLEREIAMARDSDNSERARLAASAQRTLDAIMNEVSDRYQTGLDIPEASLEHFDFGLFDRWRWAVALEILRLKALCLDGGIPAWDRTEYQRQVKPVETKQSGGLSFPVPVAREMNAYRMRRPPTLDGRMDADEWQDAGRVEDFTLAPFVLPGAPPTTVYGKAPAPLSQRALIGYDDTYLYVAFISPLPEGVLPKADARTDDGEVWSDDAVELFVKPGMGPSPYWVFIANSAGRKLDARQRDVTWNAAWDSVAGVESGRWICEIRVPWEAIRVQPKDGTTLLMNFGRNTVHAGKYAAWSPLHRTAHEPEHFGLVRLAGQPERERPSLLRLSAPDLPTEGGPLFLATLSNSGEASLVTLSADLCLNQEQIGGVKKNLSLSPGVSRVPLLLPLHEEGSCDISITLSDGEWSRQRRFRFDFTSCPPVEMTLKSNMILATDPIFTFRLSFPNPMPSAHRLTIALAAEDGKPVLRESIEARGESVLVQLPLRGRLKPGSYRCFVMTPQDDVILAKRPFAVLPGY